MEKQDDGLFLLEVLIDKILFVKSPCFSDKDFRTCVNIVCPAVEPLEICDDDSGTCVAKSGGPFVKTFNNGKSCLFSLKQEQIAQAMNNFPIKVSVYKSLPCGCLPTKIMMGEATIDMTKEFVQARKKFLEDPSNVSYEALKDSFHIVAGDGTESGEIVMFLRISCFGKIIITRFQGGGNPPKLASGSGGAAIVDRSCNPRKDFQTNQDPCACGVARDVSAGGVGAAGGQPCTPGGVCPHARDPYNSMPCEDPDEPCYCSGPKQKEKQNMSCRNTDPYCLHVPKDCCPTGNKVIFQIPSDSCGMNHKQRAHFNFDSNGIGDVARDEPGQLMPTTAENYPGVVYDFPKQVIKLRIGKTIEMPGRKSKLEYQFITPVVNHDRVVPVKDTRTAQCLPTCSDCCPSSRTLLSLPLCQELTEEQVLDIKLSHKEIRYRTAAYDQRNQFTRTLYVADKIMKSIYDLDDSVSNSLFSKMYSTTSIVTLKPNDPASILCDESDFECNFDFSTHSFENNNIRGNDGFAHQNTTVYMTLLNNYGNRRSSGTQATASINKCLQVQHDYLDTRYVSNADISSDYCSTCTIPIIKDRPMVGNWQSSEVYFWGRKKEPCGKEKPRKEGVGVSDSKTRIQKSGKTSTASEVNKKKDSKLITPVKEKSQGSSTGVQTGKSKGASASTITTKSVCIKEDKSQRPCPAGPGTSNDMIATVAHIRIGPKEPCPTYGKDPCQGPKCKAAALEGDKAPVKVTTANNPRRGVFELVIRRLTGAPLAKNELMLEWTPPTPRPVSCGAPTPMYCTIPGLCRPSKCKMVVCRSVPCKPCKRPCKKPCGPMTCRSMPCKNRCKSSCCGKPCSPCSLCPPVRPCPPLPCKSPCTLPSCSSPCGTPCKSSPCLRPCPVGRRKPRRARSQPRIKAHRKRVSPCYNRSKTCPVVQCRSVPGPCIACCKVPLCPWPPRKCCSVAPCKPPRCCKSSCSTCC